MVKIKEIEYCTSDAKRVYEEEKKRILRFEEDCMNLVKAAMPEYSYDEMEALLSEEGFLIYEHMNAAEAAEAFFREYNQKNGRNIRLINTEWLSPCGSSSSRTHTSVSLLSSSP